MAKKADIANHIVTTAVDLAAEKGWRALTLSDVAQAARVPMSALYRHCPTKPALLAGFSRMIDQAVLSEGLPSADESPRDRLFDLMMRRFDVLSAHRAGVKAILRDLRRDPLATLLQARQLELSMRWTLQSAGISTAGLLGRARVQALCLVYGLVLRTWEQDDSPELDRTMKALDQRLRQAEQWQNTFGRRRGARRTEQPAQPAASAGQEPTLH
ncbi:TetR/AcrR family transcriptional regulator [Inquilinus sp. YAF38]|uniref:TetR/AcrR family transcriptional regulator n=1 Tax=Inquilinus sp. YAF38 TaxID=3233084 RepID=UPI003F92FC14